jgi:hypothetical protein
MATGSYIAPETPGNHVQSASVLTTRCIMAKYDLTPQEFKKIRKQLFNMKLSDIMLHYPDGPRYDLALFLIAILR